MPTGPKPENSIFLPSLLGKIKPQGGLLFLQSGELFLEDGAEEILKNCKVTTTEQLMGVVLMTHTFANSAYVPYLLAFGYRRGLITKKDVLNLYCMQEESVRKHKPILTFEEMGNIARMAFPKDNQTAENLPSNWFGREELMELANQLIAVSESDLRTIFQGWFYRSEEPLPLSPEFFAYWFKETGDIFSTVDGKIASLIAIAYQKKYPELVSLEEVMQRFVKLSARDPDSHGTYRYLSLGFWIAGEDPLCKQKVLDAWVASIIEMITSGGSLFRGAQLSTEILIRESSLSPEAKKAALKKISEAAASVAKQYLNLIADAQKVVDEL